MPLYGGVGIQPTLRGLPTNLISLQPSQVYNLPPGLGGWYQITTGKYTAFQVFDPIEQIWRSIGAQTDGNHYVYADGTTNYRFANQTGCAVGALITNAGSGYTSAPTVTASAGSSIWRAIVGGAMSTTISVTNGGTGYTYPPVVLISAPPPGGIQATAYCTLTSGAVSSVTVLNQGAGYTTAPTITFQNDPREGVNGVAVGYNAAATSVLTGSGTITGLVCIDHGTGALTSVPTLSFSGGGGSSAAATAIMCWSITSYSVSTAGTALSGAVAWITAEEKFPTTAAAYTNPSTQSGLVTTRKADIKGVITASALTATQVVYDGGIYTAAPEPLVLCTASVIATAPAITLAMGGQNGGARIQPV